MPEVHIAITRRVKTDCEQQFELLLHRFVKASMHCDGVTAVHILRPPPEAPSREVGILRSFASEAQADQFYASRLFSDWSRDVAALVEGEPTRRRLSGLEAFFRERERPLPPRWKMAIVTFCGVFPAVLLWSRVLPPLLTGLPHLLTAALVNAAVVASLTWLVMPRLTHLLHAWLHAPPH